MSSFPVTSATLIAKIKDLANGDDAAVWVRFWDSYQGAIRNFAALKGGEQNADDIVMSVLGKLVEVLRSGQYTPERGRFHSYLATMIVNEVRMAHRRAVSRKSDQHVSIDRPIGDGEDDTTLGDTLAAPQPDEEALDEDWRKAVLASAREHVLMHTALSDRDRLVYRAYAEEGEDIVAVARRFGISRNLVSQIKTRIDKRIVAKGRDLLEAIS